MAQEAPLQIQGDNLEPPDACELCNANRRHGMIELGSAHAQQRKILAHERGLLPIPAYVSFLVVFNGDCILFVMFCTAALSRAQGALLSG